MLYTLLFHLVNAAVFFRTLRCVYLVKPDAAFLVEPAGYEGRFLSEEMLRRFAADPVHEMSDAFLDAALRRGDECYGLLHGETLAAYGWYAKGPTPVAIADLAIHFSPSYVYMYKGFTHEAHRGKRLHAVGMAKATAHYEATGYRGLVSYVESTNFASLKSCFRMGYKSVGTIHVLGAGGWYVTYATSGCRAFNLSLGQPRDSASQPMLFRKT